MTERGLELLTPAEAPTTAGHLLAAGTEVAGAGRYRWGTVHDLLPALSTPRFAHLLPPTSAASADARDELLRTLATLPADKALGTITDRLAHLLAGVPQTDPVDMDPARPVTDFGLDSLLGTHFLVQARDLFAIRLAPADLATGRTLNHLARLVHERLELQADDAE